METTLVELIVALIIFSLLIVTLFYLPINQYLKSKIKKLLAKSMGNQKIYFMQQSPRLLKLAVQKNLNGQWSLLTHYSFCYQKNDRQISGQVTISNKTLVDIKYHPLNER